MLLAMRCTEVLSLREWLASVKMVQDGSRGWILPRRDEGLCSSWD